MKTTDTIKFHINEHRRRLDHIDRFVLRGLQNGRQNKFADLRSTLAESCDMSTVHRCTTITPRWF